MICTDDGHEEGAVAAAYLPPVKRYSDDELRALLATGEGERLKFKSAWTRPVAVKARETVCAFANDLGGAGEPGVLVIGARDDGGPSGISVDDGLLLRLNEMRADGNIVPPPSLYVERRMLDNHQYAIVVVAPSDAPPVRYDGRIHVRTGPRRDIATAQDERILNERRRARDLPTDARSVPSATLDDIDRRRFEIQYLPAAFDREVLEANDRSYEQRLSALKLVEPFAPYTPTVAGCLGLIKSATRHIPQAYIQWLRIRGTALDNPIADELVIAGDLSTQVAKIDAKLDAYGRTEVDYVGVDRERRFSPYPARALQQLVRNALLHRDYASPSPVQVYYFDDRVEIINPGGPTGVVTVDNFGQPGLLAYRNLHLAEVMRVLDLVQRFCSGLLIARNLCAANGNPPIEFDVTQERVRVVVRAAERPW